MPENALPEAIVSESAEYTVILAPENFDDVFPITAYPSSFFVSRDGVILDSAVVGAYTELYEAELDKLLAPQE